MTLTPLDGDTSSSLFCGTLQLGRVQDLVPLFSYPNSPYREKENDVGTSNQQHDIQPAAAASSWSLEETIRHYLTASVQRDGFVDTTVEVVTIDETVQVQFHGGKDAHECAALYRKQLPRFLEIGKVGYQSYLDHILAQQHADENNTAKNWRFFLPLGVAMTRHYAVELMHFPPLYTLTEDHDYLASRSTRRWARLLYVNSSPREENDADQSIIEMARYQTIVDIVPVAAPSRAGTQMVEGNIHPHFKDYAHQLLQLWVPRQHNLQCFSARPIIAFGVPTRQWLCHNYGVELPHVLSVAQIELTMNSKEHGNPHQQIIKAPVLAANHPSYLYMKGKHVAQTGKQTEDMEALQQIMMQDLIAARFQVLMATRINNHPDDSYSSASDQDPDTVLEECRRYWCDEDRMECIQQFVDEQAFILLDDE